MLHSGVLQMLVIKTLQSHWTYQNERGQHYQNECSRADWLMNCYYSLNTARNESMQAGGYFRTLIEMNMTAELVTNKMPVMLQLYLKHQRLCTIIQFSPSSRILAHVLSE